MAEDRPGRDAHRAVNAADARGCRSAK
jgi:hypothetical protein